MEKTLRVVFAGTPDFAAQHLKALLSSDHKICAVLTQPDRPSGRGQKIVMNEVKQLAWKNHIPCYQFETLKSLDVELQLRSLNPDVIIVVAYGLLLPKEILQIPKFGCINVHASLLPRWRGASPIQHAILSGDEKSGITIMKMSEGLDAGPILCQQSCPIYNTDTSVDLYQRFLTFSPELLLNVLKQLSINQINTISQDDRYVCYANKLTKSMAVLDWHKSAIELERQVRAFIQWPGSFTTFSGKRLRIWQSEALNIKHNQSFGNLLNFSNQGIDIAAGDGVLRLLKLQISGGKILSAAEFINGYKHLLINPNIS